VSTNIFLYTAAKQIYRNYRIIPLFKVGIFSRLARYEANSRQPQRENELRMGKNLFESVPAAPTAVVVGVWNLVLNKR